MTQSCYYAQNSILSLEDLKDLEKIPLYHAVIENISYFFRLKQINLRNFVIHVVRM
jgi:hypothetical protein